MVGNSMKHTKLLKYLIDEMIEADIILYQRRFLTFIGLPEADWHIKKLSSWLNRDGGIQDRQFLKKVEESLGLPKDIWSANINLQKSTIQKAIIKHKSLLEISEDGLDISNVIPIERSITEEQEKLLISFNTLETKHEAEAKIDDFYTLGFLDKKVENQEFLVQLLKLCYDRGLYLLITEFILPAMYKNYKEKIQVQKLEAHTLGSLSQYNDAKHILSLLEDDSVIENINLRTSAISNHKRQLLSNPAKKHKKETFSLLIKCYQNLHRHHDEYSYYAGINLLYMVQLAKVLFPEDERFLSIDTQAIYDKSKPSLKEDKTHQDYFATMSGFEFRLLLGHDGILEKIESFLINNEPHISLVERTVRQMKLFMEATKKSKSSLIRLFEKAIGILEEYTKHHNPN